MYLAALSNIPVMVLEPCWRGGRVWGKVNILGPHLELSIHVSYASDLLPPQAIGTDFPETGG